jgi:hypothetical protein
MRRLIIPLISGLILASITGLLGVLFNFQARIAKLEVLIAQSGPIATLTPGTQLSIQHGRLEGTLTDRSGNPISNISVGIRNGPKSTTDMNGRFVLPNIPSGDQMIVVMPPSGGGELTRNIVVEEHATTKANIIYASDNSQLALLSITAPVDDGEILINEDDNQYIGMIHGRCDGLAQMFQKPYDIWILIRSIRDGNLWVQRPPALVNSSANTWHGRALFGSPQKPPKNGDQWAIVAVAAPNDSEIRRILNTPSLSLLPPHIGSNVAIVRSSIR